MLSKKLIMGVIGGTLLTAAAINATAATSGAYVGGQLGYGDVYKTTGHGSLLSHAAVHLFGGYQFNPNWAVEMGWTKFANLNVKFPYSSNKSQLMLSTNVMDIAAKGIVPIADQVSLYGKLGAAYVMQSVEWKAGKDIIGKGRNTEILPEAGVGVSYAFSDNVSADVFYTRVQAVKSYVSSINLAGIGLTYNFD